MAENSDNSQSKTEEPTQKRLDKARKDGQVLRSQDFSVAVTLFDFAALVFLIAGLGAKTLKQLYHYNFILNAAVTTDAGLMVEKIASSVRIVLPLIGLICSLTMIGVLVSSSLFGGIGFSLKAVAPKFSKLNPLNNLKKMFSPTALFELSKNLAKTLVIASVTALTLYFSINALGTLSIIPVNLALINAGAIMMTAMLLITKSLFLIAMINMPWQYFQHRKKLRMSLQDIKDEIKDSDGRPEVKARQRQLQHEFTINQIIAAIEEADVIITNPKHFTVALAYSPGSSNAPRVIAKGTGLIAARIREKAADHQVPIFKTPELARTLYFTTQLGNMIPKDLYHTVAEVIAYIFNLATAMKSRRPLQRPRPVVPPSMHFDENGEPLIDT